MSLPVSHSLDLRAVTGAGEIPRSPRAAPRPTWASGGGQSCMRGFASRLGQVSQDLK